MSRRTALLLALLVLVGLALWFVLRDRRAAEGPEGTAQPAAEEDWRPRSAAAPAGPPVPGTGNFYTVEPCRLLDTREAADGPALSDRDERHVQVTGRCGVPASARSVVLVVTTIKADRGGELALAPASEGHGALTVPIRSDRNSSQTAILALGRSGDIRVRVVDAKAHVVLNATGYFD